MKYKGNRIASKADSTYACIDAQMSASYPCNNFGG